MSNLVNVNGENKGNLMLYALSTCVWCRKTKDYLDEMGIAYTYVYVDLESNREQEKLEAEIAEFNPEISFPTLIINNKECVVGYSPEKIRSYLNV
ncbi:MAG: glutaredoxin family protein [Fusobacteria bacterium]|nr:glutaredoxin family protein [Fusobacteriota bacterium]